MKNSFYLLIITIFLFYACAYNSGQMASHFTPTENQKYEFVDLAIGYTKSNYFFGLGGFNKTLSYNNAKRNLFFSYPLKSNETLENIIIDKKVRRIGPFKTVEVIAIADVIKHSQDAVVKYSAHYSNLLYNIKANSRHFITLNENVLILNSKNTTTKAKVIKHNANSSYATVFYLTEYGNFKIKKIGYDKLFKIENMNTLNKTNGLSIGDSVYFERSIEVDLYKNQTSEIAEIIGLNELYTLLNTKKGYERFSLLKVRKIEKK